MKLLSFDVGIKNLAFCQLDTNDKSILDWGIINISIDPTCEHIHKGKCCDKTAQKIIKSTGLKLCNNHMKQKSYKDVKMNNIKKIDNNMFKNNIWIFFTKVICRFYDFNIWNRFFISA